MAQDDLPQHIRAFIVQFENALTTDEFDDPRFSYRVSFIRRTTGSKTAADKVIEFVPPGSDLEIEANKVFLKETERTKFGPGSIVSRMKAEGFPLFNMKHHTELWKGINAKDPRYQFGADVEGTWFWYETWLAKVRAHCQENQETYRARAPVQAVA